MTIESVIPALGATGAFSALALKSPKLMKEIYEDIAKPGVQQVGAALKTILLLGNNILLPLRLLNETTRAFEQKKFDDIAKRFKDIPIDDVIETSPEIGVPIMDKLSYTSDKTLRTMFIELLAKASSTNQVSLAHPSFVNVISSLSPDEAVLLKSLKHTSHVPMISLEAVSAKDGCSSILDDMVVIPPIDLTYPDRIPLYISNIVGLGIIEIRRDNWIAADGAYDHVESYGRSKYNGVKSVYINGEERPIKAKKHLIVVQPYGKSFINSCN